MGEKKEDLMHLHLLPRQLSLAFSLTPTEMHTSSIKAHHSLLQLSIRKLSLGFRALAYRHLCEAFCEKCSKQGPAICIEFTVGERREVIGQGRRWFWCWGGGGGGGGGGDNK